MEKNVSAVFYDFKYYLLPEGIDINSLKDGTELKTKRLKEERCMAPDFIYESIAEETLKIEKRELLYPVSVNLYSGKEYDEILSKQIDRVCRGCMRFIDNDDPSLDGHHREISLEGVCYEREEDDGIYSFALRADWFFAELSKHLNELAECIERGNAKKFDKICKKCARYYIECPVRFAGGKKDGKYCLYMQAGFGNDLYYALLVYIAQTAELENNPLFKAGWTVSPCVPAGMEGYGGKIKDDTPTGFIKQSEDAVRWYDIYLYLKSPSMKKRQKRVWELYDYLCYKAGESAVIRTVDSYEAAKSKEGLLTASQIAEKIAEKDGEFDETNSFPAFNPLSWTKAENALPYKRNAEGFSVCYTLSSIGANADLVKNVHFDGRYSYAYVFVPASEENVESVSEIFKTYFGGEKRIPEPVILKEYYQISCMPCGAFICSDGDGNIRGVAFDFLVTDEKAFYRFMKILAPVTAYHCAHLITVNGGGVREYVLGNKITPFGSGVHS